METLVLTPHYLRMEKIKHEYEKITISGSRVIFSAKTVMTLALKKGDSFSIVLQNKKVFYQDKTSGADGFVVNTFGKEKNLLGANAPGLAELLASFKKLHPTMAIEVQKTAKSSVKLVFGLGNFHEGGLWELIPLPM